MENIKIKIGGVRKLKKKKLKIVRTGYQQVGIRITSDIFSQLKKLAKNNKTSVQEVMRFILQEEIKNYE